MKKSKALFSLVSLLSTTVIGSGSVFAATTGGASSQQNTPVTTTLQAPSNPTNPTPPQPDGPNQGDNSNNNNNNVQGTFGIAYQPKAFSFTTDSLNSNGEQVIPVSNPHAGATYNVGVKDMTHDTRGWTLTAQLNWNGSAITGATIETSNATGSVNKNNNTGGDFNAATDLVATTDATGTANLSINNAAQTVMTGKEGVIHNAVYDYSLGNVSLKIPDTSVVAAGQYSGNVDWNLSVTPTNP
ncbi:hypothetical protein IGJ91_002946 [Enterococcus sp. DIV0765f]|uniref:WxL domain-containing protein n=1 Tax=Enterococcus sp. DIV0765f TaxID=2774783 RepID=UPI003F2862A2